MRRRFALFVRPTKNESDLYQAVPFREIALSSQTERYSYSRKKLHLTEELSYPDRRLSASLSAMGSSLFVTFSPSPSQNACREISIVPCSAGRPSGPGLLVKSSLGLFTGEFIASQDSVGDELNVSVCSSDAIVVLQQ